MHPLNSYTMAQARVEELLREAEHMRLVQEAMLQQNDHRRFYRRWANWLGIHMVRWGEKLEGFGTFGQSCSTQSPSSLS
jgi:hypothetical protein